MVNSESADTSIDVFQTVYRDFRLTDGLMVARSPSISRSVGFLQIVRQGDCFEEVEVRSLTGVVYLVLVRLVTRAADRTWCVRGT